MERLAMVGTNVGWSGSERTGAHLVKELSMVSCTGGRGGGGGSCSGRSYKRVKARSHSVFLKCTRRRCVTVA